MTTPARQAELLRLAADHDGSTESFWRRSGSRDGFGDQVDSIRYVVELGA